MANAVTKYQRYATVIYEAAVEATAPPVSYQPREIRDLYRLMRAKHKQSEKLRHQKDPEWLKMAMERNQLRNRITKLKRYNASKQKEQLRVEKIAANPSQAWTKLSKIKRWQRSSTNQPPELSRGEEQQFTKYWSGMYAGERLQYEPTEIETWSYDTTTSMIKGLPRGKAAGPDGLTAECLQYGGKAATDMTHDLICSIFREKRVPQAMNNALIFLIPKDRKVLKDPKAHRPISLMNVWLKLIDKHVQQLLRTEYEDKQIISPEQASFRPGHSTTT